MVGKARESTRLKTALSWEANLAHEFKTCNHEIVGEDPTVPIPLSTFFKWRGLLKPGQFWYL
jgi:hypothetical protein